MHSLSGGRPGVQKVCIVLTNERKKADSEDSKALEEAVEPLHQAGVRVIAIGVTSAADWRQLRALTEDPKDIIRSNSCDSLVAKVSYLFKRVCYGAGKNMYCMVWHCMVLHSTIWHAWHGMAWHAWHGMVRVWYDIKEKGTSIITGLNAN